MANNNPDTSGLVSLADRDNNERTTIATQGGIASGKKRREIKRISDIVYGIRQEGEIDPVVGFVKSLFEILQDTNTKTSDLIKILQFMQSMESELKSNSDIDSETLAEFLKIQKNIEQSEKESV